MGTALSIIVSLFISLMHPGKSATVTSQVQVQAQDDINTSPTETPSVTSEPTVSISPTDTPSVTPSISPSVSPTSSPSPSVSPEPTGADDNDDTSFGSIVSEAAHVRNTLRFDEHLQEKTEVNENAETQADTK